MYKVYWTDNENKSYGEETEKLTVALALTENLRSRGNRFVTMVSENPDQVGKAGVASVEDGKTPDGFEYTWSKQGRAGKSKKSSTVITVKDV